MWLADLHSVHSRKNMVASDRECQRRRSSLKSGFCVDNNGGRKFSRQFHCRRERAMSTSFPPPATYASSPRWRGIDEAGDKKTNKNHEKKTRKWRIQKRRRWWAGMAREGSSEGSCEWNRIKELPVETSCRETTRKKVKWNKLLNISKLSVTKVH